ncbi:MAG TPA: DNA polymerase IV [Acidimicrobiales bacterium]|nr:DNA polymerase IV [Acidimicrobiales bacterium]
MPAADAEPRTILHVDMDAFYASVEQLRRPELRGRPVVVGGSGRRGVVAAASYEARAFGVRSAMPSLRARTLCPHAVFVPGDHAHYAEVSARVMAIFRDVTPLVEPLSLDEAFLDVTGARRLHGDGPAIAAEIRRRVLDQEGLTCSVGVAPNKFLAKLATEQAKPSASVRGPVPGTGVAVVRPGDERAFLRPLPVEALWGVGPKTLERLHGLGVRTVGQLERLPLDQLVRAVGEAHGRHLHELAHAVDARPVVPDQRPKSISHEETFSEDLHHHDAVRVELVRMADAVARRARAHDTAGRTVSIKVRFGDFTTITRSVTLPQPIATGPAITRAATALLDAVDVAPGVRLFGVGLGNLADDAPQQLSLEDLAGGAAPDPAGAAWTAVTEAVDAVRARFGDDALVPASLATGERRAKRTGDRQWGPVEAGFDGPDEGVGSR